MEKPINIIGEIMNQRFWKVQTQNQFGQVFSQLETTQGKNLQEHASKLKTMFNSFKNSGLKINKYWEVQ